METPIKRFVKLHQHPLDGEQELWFDPQAIVLIYPYQFGFKSEVQGTTVFAGSIGPLRAVVTRDSARKPPLLGVGSMTESFATVMNRLRLALYGSEDERNQLKVDGLLIELPDWREPTP